MAPSASTSQNPSSQALVTVTEKAAQELKTALSGQTNIAGVRLGVQGGGCCGPGYVLALEEKVSEGDQIIEAGGVKLFVAPSDVDQVRGAKLDFIETQMGSGFAIDNPNLKSEGGHGHGHSHGGCGGGGCGSGGGCGCGSGGGHGHGGGCC